MLFLSGLCTDFVSIFNVPGSYAQIHIVYEDDYGFHNNYLISMRVRRRLKG